MKPNQLKVALVLLAAAMSCNGLTCCSDAVNELSCGATTNLRTENDGAVCKWYNGSCSACATRLDEGDCLAGSICNWVSGKCYKCKGTATEKACGDKVQCYWDNNRCKKNGSEPCGPPIRIEVEGSSSVAPSVAVLVVSAVLVWLS